MSVRCMSRVWDHSKLSGSALLMLLAIADYASDDGTNAYPSISTLAKKTRMTPRNVQRTIRTICESGELVISTGTGRGNTNQYIVTVRETPTSVTPFTTETLTPTSPFNSQNDVERVTSRVKRVTSTVERVTPTSPDPLDPLDPSSKRDSDETKELTRILQHAGLILSPIIVDKYMDLVKEVGMPNVLRGFDIAVANNKQHRFNYVQTCARSPENTNNYANGNQRSALAGEWKFTDTNHNPWEKSE